jgi:hypothetical protein
VTGLPARRPYRSERDGWQESVSIRQKGRRGDQLIKDQETAERSETGRRGDQKDQKTAEGCRPETGRPSDQKDQEMRGRGRGRWRCLIGIIDATKGSVVGRWLRQGAKVGAERSETDWSKATAA